MVEPQQEHVSPKVPLAEEKAEVAGEKPSSPQSNAIKPAGERSPSIPFGLPTAGGSGMDFFDGKGPRMPRSCNYHLDCTSLRLHGDHSILQAIKKS